MNAGKVSETILKRSVLKQVKKRREEVLHGAAAGEDCAILKLSSDEFFSITSDPVTAEIGLVGTLAVHHTLNNLFATGAEPVGVTLVVLLPENTKEKHIKEIMSQVTAVCAAYDVQILGGHTEVNTAVAKPILIVTGIGKAKEPQLKLTAVAKPEEDIVVTKWIGLEGSYILAKEKEEELASVFPKRFIEEVDNFETYLSIFSEAALASKSDVSAMHDIAEGGIYGALWELAECAGVGLEIDLKAIPVRQETIEICEHFGLNPYHLLSGGSMLITATNGYDMVRELKKIGIHGTVIGKTTKELPKKILNGEEIGFLERPKADEIYKMR